MRSQDKLVLMQLKMYNIQLIIIFSMLVIVIVALILLAFGLYRAKLYFNGPSYVGPKQNLEGYTAIVTGGGGGIGMEVATDLAIQGCEVIIADIVNSEHIAAQINAKLKTLKVIYMELDLGSLQSIQDFVKKLQIDKLDFLINNAGVLGGERKISYTKSKFELHNGINYIGHFYLTHLLWEKLNKSKFFRVVIVSSMAHRKVLGFRQNTTLEYGKFNFQDIPYNKDLAYSRSKLYLTMFAKSLAEITPQDKGLITAIHPGIARTTLIRNRKVPTIQKIINTLTYPIFYLLTKSTKDAAQTILYIAYSDPKDLKSGCYYADCALATASPLVQTQHRKMFDITQETLGIKFGQN